MAEVSANRVDRLLVGRKDAAALLSLGVRTFDRANASGHLGPVPVRIGGRLLWNVSELTAWSAASDDAGELFGREAWLARQKRSGVCGG